MKKSYVKSKKEYDNETELNSKKILAAMKKYKAVVLHQHKVLDESVIDKETLSLF